MRLRVYIRPNNYQIRQSEDIFKPFARSPAEASGNAADPGHRRDPHPLLVLHHPRVGGRPVDAARAGVAQGEDREDQASSVYAEAFRGS